MVEVCGCVWLYVYCVFGECECVGCVLLCDECCCELYECVGIDCMQMGCGGQLQFVCGVFVVCLCVGGLFEQCEEWWKQWNQNVGWFVYVIGIGKW